MTAEREIATFLAKYTPERASALQEARRQISALVPRGYELVYDNYNALVFGFGPTERASDAILSVAGYPKWLTLFFLKGAHLEDPEGLLQGTGTSVRSIRLSSLAMLRSVPVASLIRQALAPASSAFEAAPPLRTVVKSVSAKQRPRRPIAPATNASKQGKRPSAT